MSLWMNSNYSTELTPHMVVRLRWSAHVWKSCRPAGARLVGREQMSTLTRLAEGAGRSLRVQQGRAQSQTHGVDIPHRFFPWLPPTCCKYRGSGALRPVRELHRVLNEQWLWITGPHQVHTILLKLCLLKISVTPRVLRLQLAAWDLQ